MNKLYLKLAWSNLKNSRQFYLPYVIAGMLSAMMFYTMCAIQGNEGLSKMRGGASVQMVLFFGVIVVGVFVSIFLFYTNSFIMKRRKKGYCSLASLTLAVKLCAKDYIMPDYSPMHRRCI